MCCIYIFKQSNNQSWLFLTIVAKSIWSCGGRPGLLLLRLRLVVTFKRSRSFPRPAGLAFLQLMIVIFTLLLIPMIIFHKRIELGGTPLFKLSFSSCPNIRQDPVITKLKLSPCPVTADSTNDSLAWCKSCSSSNLKSPNCPMDLSLAS